MAKILLVDASEELIEFLVNLDGDIEILTTDDPAKVANSEYIKWDEFDTPYIPLEYNFFESSLAWYMMSKLEYSTLYQDGEWKSFEAGDYDSAKGKTRCESIFRYYVLKKYGRYIEISGDFIEMFGQRLGLGSYVES